MKLGQPNSALYPYLSNLRSKSDKVDMTFVIALLRYRVAAPPMLA